MLNIIHIFWKKEGSWILFTRYKIVKLPTLQGTRIKKVKVGAWISEVTSSRPATVLHLGLLVYNIQLHTGLARQFDYINKRLSIQEV